MSVVRQATRIGLHFVRYEGVVVSGTYYEIFTEVCDQIRKLMLAGHWSDLAMQSAPTDDLFHELVNTAAKTDTPPTLATEGTAS